MLFKVRTKKAGQVIGDCQSRWQRSGVALWVFCLAMFLLATPGQSQEEWTWTTRSGKIQGKAEFDRVLKDHLLWLSSQGLQGRRSLLDRAKLRRVDMSDQSLSRAGFAFSDLSDANMAGADLFKADLEGASLKGAALNSVRLEDARLDGANLSGADLAGANLGNARLVRANLNGANLVGANLKGADLIISSLNGAALNGVNLRNVSLVGADLRGANLAGAILVNANLTGAKLSDANLSNTDLSRARLDGADLGEANLTSIRSDGGLHFNEDTVWPADFIPPRNLNNGWDRFYVATQALGVSPFIAVGVMIFMALVIVFVLLRSAMRHA